jgi:four helix bundle protein
MEPKMSGHRDLETWQKAMELVKAVYVATRHFPKDELYGLTSRIRRAAVSIPSNISEAYGRNTRNELPHFLGPARGSLAELETQLEIAGSLGYLNPAPASALLSATADLGRMLTGLHAWSTRGEAAG